jgi:Ser/Thr protein kinase RdoA (MazF antagonist)
MLGSVEDSADVEFLRELARDFPTVAGQALHGDAHMGNCLSATTGPLWHDFESTCHGPREYDLAALVLRDRSGSGYAPSREALAAYGEHDADLLDALLPVYAAWIYASFLVSMPRRPDLGPRLERRLAWLREYVFARQGRG